uniref:F-box domain-containing protein n=1 Tax=Moniliophthora roreri TaxID=221103 RepID=A0A0W0FAF3_MONRR
MRNILNLNLPLKPRWRRPSQLILDPLDETRPGRPLPNLPPELWVLIIRYASTPPPYLQLPLPEEDHEVYMHSMEQKRSFSLVSKRWNSYTAEVLYEFIWISRAKQAKSLALTLLCQVCASPVVHPSSYHHQNSLRRTTSSDQCGKHIRRLKIATSTLDRCDPADIRVILDYAANLECYEDHRSVRRNNEEEMLDPRGSPEALLAALGRGGKSGLRRLTWTCYGLDNGLTGLASLAANLEYLELSFSGASSSYFTISPLASSSSTSIISNSGFSFTTTSITTTTTTTCTTTITAEPMPPLALPALKTLNVTFDNMLFLALSEWDMPHLTSMTINLSHHHTTPAFHTFFKAHGTKITHLELGYAPTPDSLIVSHQDFSPDSSTLYQLAPNLKEFICSAHTQTEWNWENPDWIAPHPLLTSHPELEYIGIRDLGREVRRVWSEVSRHLYE